MQCLTFKRLPLKIILIAQKFSKSHSFHFDFICTGFETVRALVKPQSANSFDLEDGADALSIVWRTRSVITVLCKFKPYYCIQFKRADVPWGRVFRQ